MADRKKPARWRLYHDDPKTFRLARSGVDLIAAQQTRKGDWFWYTLSLIPPAIPCLISALFAIKSENG